jgi:hypothetical protein
MVEPASCGPGRHPRDGSVPMSRGIAPLNQRLSLAGETPPEAVIHGHFNGVGPFI